MSKNLSPEVIAEIVRRLAQAFDVQMNSLGPNDTIRPEDAAMLLGIDNDELGNADEIGLVIKMGILKGTDQGRVEPADMLRFLEEHGEVWTLTRLEMLRAKLRQHVAESSAVAAKSAGTSDEP